VARVQAQKPVHKQERWQLFVFLARFPFFHDSDQNVKREMIINELSNRRATANDEQGWVLSLFRSDRFYASIGASPESAAWNSTLRKSTAIPDPFPRPTSNRDEVPHLFLNWVQGSALPKEA
jgi:hypothetical protein